MALTVLTWNLFHGRDFPPNPALRTWRSRLLRVSERDATHLQVNRELFDEFAGLLAGARWDLALLQESPPRWATGLARACNAEHHLCLTSRNSFSWVRAALARLNPDLIASNEGGSSLTLVRRDAGRIIERHELELGRGPGPERRTMAFTRIELIDERQICVANLHASAGPERRALAEEQVMHAAARAAARAASAPLILGGDLNLRPRQSTAFARLEARFGLLGPTSPGSLDHLLYRDLEALSPAASWAPEQREVAEDALRIRLSDHAPVQGEFRIDAG